jgi:adenine-specific DNA-methyltransferase
VDSFNLVIDENSHFLDDDACRKISTRVHADEGCDLKLSSYPKTRFYGSKRRQLNWLFPHLRRLSGTTVLDAFGGTGSVSLLFSQLGKLVTYNDVFRFQEISAKALLGDLGGLVLAPERLASFLATVTPRNGLVTQCFQGLYFTQAENGWLDGVMERISCVASIPEKSVLLYCLFQACLSKRPYNLFHRANLNIRQSKEHVSFGNRTTWEKSFGEHMMSAYRELIRGRKLLKHPINVMPCGSVEDLDIGFDIVYMDPPYFNSHRYTESYLLRYHFLEGLARFDEWESLIEHGSKIKKLSDNAVPAEWRSKHDFTPALFSLIDRFRSSTVVLSYVADAHPNENQIAEHFESRFKKCRVIRMDCRRTLSRRIRTELLFIGEP